MVLVMDQHFHFIWLGLVSVNITRRDIGNTIIQEDIGTINPGNSEFLVLHMDGQEHVAK